jgi:hypothetical protein
VDSNHDCWGQGPADCHYLIPHLEPPSGADPDLAPHRGAVTAVCGGRVRSVVRSVGLEPTTSSTSCWRLCQSWATSAWSRYPVPTRVTRRTKAEPQPCAAAKLPGLESNQCEPRFRASVGCQQPARYRLREAGAEPRNDHVLGVADWPHSRMVRRERLERSPRRLRVCCSSQLS